MDKRKQNTDTAEQYLAFMKELEATLAAMSEAEKNFWIIS